jgi:hypothetical protein
MPLGYIHITFGHVNDQRGLLQLRCLLNTCAELKLRADNFVKSDAGLFA